MHLDISLQQKQFDALKILKDTKVLFYGGAKGGGKSYLMRAYTLMRALKYPKTAHAIVRKTYKQLDLSHIQEMYREYPEVMKDMYKSSKREIELFNGSRIFFLYLESKRDIANYQGAQFDTICVDEATEHEEEVLKLLMSSARATIEGITPRILLTGNPGGIGHQFVKRLFIDRDFNDGESSIDYAFLQALVHDNTILLDRDPNYLDTLKALPDKYRRAYLDGDWEVFEGQYFDEWAKWVHVVDPFDIPKEWLKYRSVDWGFNPDPAVCSWYTVAPSGITYKYREIKVNKMLPADFGRYVIGLTGDEKIEYTVGDPSMFANKEGESIASQIAEGGLNIGKAINARVDGWLKLKEYLKWKGDRTSRTIIEEPRYKVFDTCIHTINAYPTLLHSDKRPEDIEDGDDHAADTDRYFFMSRPKATDVPIIEPEMSVERAKASKDIERILQQEDEYYDDVLGEYI